MNEEGLAFECSLCNDLVDSGSHARNCPCKCGHVTLEEAHNVCPRHERDNCIICGSED